MTNTASRLSLGAALLFATLLAAPAPAAAQTPGGDVVSCGGRGEPACAQDSEFTAQNAGRCDRGLAIAIDGTCVNGLRRQGPGGAFRNSWLGRALRTQLDDLNPNTPINKRTMIGIHNAYNNEADAYHPFYENQRYSITELLDAGFRTMELDVHSNRFGYLKLCHVLPGGECFNTDRWFANAIKEIRDWLREPGHSEEILVIEVENYVRPEDAAQFDAVIKAYLADVPGIGVLRPSDLIAFDPANVNYPSMGGTDFDRLVWPSQSWLVAHHKRVVVIMRGVVGNYGIGANGTIDLVHVDLTTCKDGNDSVEARTVYSDELPFGAAPLTRDKAAKLTRCVPAIISADQLINPDNPILSNNYDKTRLEGAAWSWAPGQPSSQPAWMSGYSHAGKAAMMNNDGRWEARPRTEHHRFLCGSDSYWYITLEEGAWGEGPALCAATPFVPSLAPPGVPATGGQNSIANFARIDAGVTDVWLNFLPVGEGTTDRWEIPRPLTLTIRPPASALTGLTTTFLVSWSGSPSFTSIEWDLGDAFFTSEYPASHAYARAGTYTVSATLIDDFGRSATAMREVLVRDPDDPSLAELTIDGPSVVSAGTTAVYAIGYAAGWVVRLDSVSCGSPATHAVRESLAMITATGGRVRWELKCRYSPDIAFSESSRVNQTITASVVGFNDTCFPACGTTLTETFAVTVLVPPTVVLSSTGLATHFTGSTYQFFVAAFDPDGGAVTASAVSCGPVGLVASGVTKLPSGFGAYVFDCAFMLPAAANPVTVTFTDDDGVSRSSTVTVHIIDATAPVLSMPHSMIVGATSDAGARVEFEVIADDFVNGYRSVTCTPASGHTFPIGTTTVSCSASDASGNAVHGTFSITVKVPVVVVPQYANPDHHWRLGGAHGAIDSGLGSTLNHGARNPLITDAEHLACRPNQHGLLFPGGTGANLYDPALPALDLQSAGDLGTGNFTIAFWLKTAAPGPVLSNRGPSSFNYFDIFVNDQGRLSAAFGNEVFVGRTVTDNKWHHVTVRRTGDIVDLFFEGFLLYSYQLDNSVVDITSGSPLMMGGAWTTTTTGGQAARLFTGALDEVSLFSRALEGIEINQIAGALADRNNDGQCDTNPADVEADSETGAPVAVSFTATVELLPGLPTSADCRLASGDIALSGSLFPAGDTEVFCADPDNAYAPAVSFIVRVHTSSPTLHLPDTITSEALPGQGVAIGYTVTATDEKDGPVPFTCSPAAGSMFPIGTTLVECTATDSDGHVTVGAFSVIVSERRLPTTLTAEAVMGTSGQLMTLTARLIAAGAALPGVVVSFQTIEGTVSAATDDNGDATVQFTPANAGVSSYTATFDGVPGYHPTSVTNTITVATAATALSALATTTPATVGGTLLVTTTLTRTVAPVSTVAGASVTFTLTGAAGNPNGATSETLTVTTDNSGVASASFNLSARGGFTVTADYAGSTGNAPATRNTTITVYQRTTLAVAVQGFFAHAPNGMTATLQTLPDGLALPNQTVSFTFSGGGAAETAEVTNSTGKATAAPTFTIADSFQVTASFLNLDDYFADENGQPLPTTATATATVQKQNSSLSLNAIPASAFVGDSLLVRASLLRVGSGLPGTGGIAGDIVFRLTNDATAGFTELTAATTTSTSASVTFVLTSPGNFTVTASYAGTPGIHAASGAPRSIEVISPNTPPTFTAPADITVEATGPGGAPVTLEFSGSDAEQGQLPASCAPGSGTFAIGTTAVTCTVTDDKGATASGTFNVIVRDTTAPMLTLPVPAPKLATSVAGAAVAFSVTASDLVDGARPVGCTLNGSPVSSGSTFPIGTSTVQCTASDTRGNSSNGSFSATVTAPTVATLVAQVQALSLPQGTENSLLAKLRAGSLGAFQNEVAAQSGKKIPAAAAKQLIDLAKLVAQLM